ncbi:serine hydrolase domain-containing protein [Actinomadura roseirufa]|uniref:serine hydrolase domain-containing protein n=1 Tax=Actinomadura roseirufa TaxID=2094049 RepID=UPI001041A78C|nr:serine hydrolase domain-containing protein [Actinomadura roseirufa]
MDEVSVRGVDRRRLLGWGGLAAAAGVAAAGAQMVGARPGHTESAPTDPIPPDTQPGGAYDRYVAKLAADGKFSGVVLLSHQGRTVLCRSYGMADKNTGIRNHEGIAFSLGSAGKPFEAVAILQLAQQGKLRLSDTVGTHLKGYATDIAEKVTLHHMLTATGGMDAPDLDLQRVFNSREDVHEYYEQWSRQARLVVPPGSGDQGHTDGAGAGITMLALIVEAVTGQTYWDYVQEHIFGRCEMTGSAFYTRPQWLTDRHIAHPYMTLADGSQVDAIRNLDKSSPNPQMLGKNPGRAFIDAPGDGGFATARDLARFGHALGDGTVLERPWADVFTAANSPHGPASFGTYGPVAKIVGDQWVWSRGGGNPGVGANWSIYPYTDWVGVILSNIDGVPLQEMVGREMQAITGVSPGGEGGGGGGGG